jgi:hypothetical protein
MAAHIQVVAQYSDFWDQYSSFMVGLVRIGEIDVTSVTDMVNKIIAKLSTDNAKMALLEIFAHGSAQHISIGDDDAIHAFTPKQHMPTLVRLKTHFTSQGAVVLQVCEVGQAQNVLIEMAKTLGVPVFANTGDVSPNLPGFGDGINVVARPDGTFANQSVSVPSFVDGDAAAVAPPPDPRFIYGI